MRARAILGAPMLSDTPHSCLGRSSPRPARCLLSHSSHSFIVAAVRPVIVLSQKLMTTRSSTRARGGALGGTGERLSTRPAAGWRRRPAADLASRKKRVLPADVSSLCVTRSNGTTASASGAAAASGSGAAPRAAGKRPAPSASAAAAGSGVPSHTQSRRGLRVPSPEQHVTGTGD